MLIEEKALHGMTIHALDGEVGKVDEILFDDHYWKVRYLIGETGNWLFGRQVLISPLSFGHQDWDQHVLNINLTRSQIENSPGIDTDKPVSRQWETDYCGYYGWPFYWGGTAGVGTGGWGSQPYPGLLLTQPRDSAVSAEQKVAERECERADAGLRSTNEVTGYGISATDGHIGHIENFIVDDETWEIRYLAADTRDWWPEKKVLLPAEWIEHVNWPARSVTVNVRRDQVKNAPEWDRGEPISSPFEDQLNSYYAQVRLTGVDVPKRSRLVKHERMF